MNLAFYLTFLCWFANFGWASVLAGPYLTLFLWYAYRIEVVQFGPQGTLTGKGCVGTAPGRGCYFDEFLKYIDRAAEPSDLFKGSTGIGENLTPDVPDAVNKLKQVGWRSTFDPSKLLPDHFKRGESPSLAKLLNPVMDNIAATRQFMIESGRDELRSAELAGIRFSSHMGITVLGNLQARRADQGKYMIEAFNNEKAANKINFSTETTTRTNVIDGSTYEELDPEKMLRNNPTMSKEIKDTIIGFVKDYNGRGGKGITPAKHYDRIQVSQELAMKAHDPVCLT